MGRFAWLLVLLVGCAPTPDVPAAAPLGPPPGEVVPTSMAPDLPRLGAVEAVAAGGLEDTGPITWRVDPSATWDCGQDSVYCADPYIELAFAIADPERDLHGCADYLPEQSLDLGVYDAPQDAWSADDLAADLREGLDLDWLLDGLAQRPLELVLVEERVQGGLRQQRILATDPIVGTMQWRLLWPANEERPLRGILAFPGHPMSDDAGLEFIDSPYGRPLAEAGYLLAVPSVRAYDSMHAESDASAYLICAGSSLLAMRHYEALLLDRALRWLGVPDLSLVGHSGGSVTMNALVRHDSRWRAAVSDLQSTYAVVMFCVEGGPEGGYCLLDEVHPHLSRRHPQINREDLVPRMLPWSSHEYGYPEGVGPILDFLGATPPQ